MILFVGAIKGPECIQEQFPCLCLEVRAIAEVCLSTHSIQASIQSEETVHRHKQLETDLTPPQQMSTWKMMAEFS